MVRDCSLVNGTFSGKPTGSEKFLTHMVETLSITADKTS